MTPDDPGMLGNLPRSRPGRRSDKRSGGVPPTPPRKATAAKESQPPEDPVGTALKAAAKGVGTGLRVANGVTREVLRRLPGR